MTGRAGGAAKRICAGLLMAACMVVLAGCNNRNSPEATPATAAGEPSSTVSSPTSVEDAQLLMEINKAIAEVTQEAMQRPKEDRMTAEEINARIRQKIDEIKARQQK